MSSDLLKIEAGRFRTTLEAFHKLGMGDVKSAFCVRKKIRNGKGATCLPGMLYLSGEKNDFESCPFGKHKKTFAASIYPGLDCLQAKFRPVYGDSCSAEAIKKAVMWTVLPGKQAEPGIVL